MFGCFSDGFMGGGGWPGMLGMLLLLVLAGWLIYGLVNSRRQNHGDRRDCWKSSSAGWLQAK